MAAHSDTIDVVEAGRAVRRGWRWIAGAVAAGALIATAVLLFVPPQFESASSVVVRESSAGGASLLSRLGSGAGAVSGVLGIGGSGSLKTELGVLQSRAMVAPVVDSLLLQAVITSHRLPANAVFAGVSLPGQFPRQTYRFARDADGRYRVAGKGAVPPAPPGIPMRLPVGKVVLKAGANLPEEFEAEFSDRQDAVSRTQRGLRVSAPAGEVIEVLFTARDSATAAAVPNMLLAEYVTWRRGTDRGVNRHRVEFLTAQADSIAAQLSAAERHLRSFQERSGVIEPVTIGRIQLERAGELRKEMGALDVEQGALDQLLAQVRSGQMSARQLAAYPTFLRSAAINQLIGQLTTLETERSALLERRLESDASVAALDESIRHLEGQLVPLAAAYRTSVARQRSDVARQLDTLTNLLGGMPATTESATRLQRDVLQLGQIHAAVQAQLVEARLAAVGEGGDIRELDAAEPPKKPAFPQPVSTLGAGVGAGLIIGLILALFAGLLGRWIEDPRAIERTAGVPALRLDSAVPLLVAGTPASATVLLVPIVRGTSTVGVAERLARTAMARGQHPTVLDLSGGSLPAQSDAATGSAMTAVERLERDGGMVIVQLPGLSSDVTAAALNPTRPVLLVAAAGRLDRQELLSAVDTLRRLDAPCAGVVLNRTSDAIAAG